MNTHWFAVMLVAGVTLLSSCKKATKQPDCFSGRPTVRLINNRPAVVKVTGTANGIYLIEQGTIDVRLLPCNLPVEFVQADLPVTVSGEVKGTIPDGGPCCTDAFVITKISR